MDFPPEALDKLRGLYYAEFGKEINRDEAREIGTRLLNFIMLLRQPPPRSTQPHSSDL